MQSITSLAEQTRKSQMDISPITDADILWAKNLLGLPNNAFTERIGYDHGRDVLCLLESADIAACPGSGKTTILVAKLAVLARKWSSKHRGICVLSHTNVARNEIANRLSGTLTGES